MSIEQIEKFPPAPLLLDNTHFHVTSINVIEKTKSGVLDLLNDAEKKRAARFINPEHGKRFALVRGFLRHTLGSYLDQDPAKIVFLYNQYGQPSVSTPSLKHAFHFNISHSHEMAAFAFSSRKVGIDIEFVKEVKNLDAMTRYISHPIELEQFSTMAKAEMLDSFFRLWTRKEAFIKANGQGLSMGLRSINIGAGVHKTIKTLQYKDKHYTNWHIQDLVCDSTYKLAIAIEQGMS